MQDKNITTIYTSPLQRASETARIIADAIGIEGIVTHEGLIERDWVKPNKGTKTLIGFSEKVVLSI